jgi:hypothetical protein
VGIDGGYIRDWEQKQQHFKVIVGKSILHDLPAKCFGFGHSYDSKPKRRLFEVLKSQGMQINQQITFLSDGGDTMREIPLYLNRHSEHLLDWFHLAMRITVLGRYAKGLVRFDWALGEEIRFPWLTREIIREMRGKQKYATDPHSLRLRGKSYVWFSS